MLVLCVLLVEDEWLIRSIMAESLMDAGFDVIHAGSGNEAFERIEHEKRKITILVTDVHLPGGLNGLDVAEEMRRRVPGLPVVVATGRPDVLRPDWHLAGSVALLRKPYGPGELLATVRNALGQC